MTPRDGWILLAVALSAYFGYYAVPAGDARNWAYYIATGALMAAVGAVVRIRSAGLAGMAAGCLMLAEGAQQSICGLATMGIDPAGRDVCRAWLGEDIYRAAGSLALSGLLLVMLWRRNRRP